jgi:hypothetical protein
MGRCRRVAAVVTVSLLCCSGCQLIFPYSPGEQTDAAADARIITLLDGPPPERYSGWYDGGLNDAGSQIPLDAGDACVGDTALWICDDTGETFSSCGVACGTLTLTCTGLGCTCANHGLSEEVPVRDKICDEMPEGTWSSCGIGAACITALKDGCCDLIR